MSAIIDVTRALRTYIEDVDPDHLITALAAGQISDADPVTIRRFIAQAMAHQSLAKDSADSRVFAAKILSVKRITRNHAGSVLGRKAEITMETSEKGGGTQEETIDTGWVEYRGEDDPAKVTDQRLVWEIALSRSIEEDAKALVGRKAFVRKVVVAAGDSNKRVRSIIDIDADFRDAKASSDEPAPKSSSNAGTNALTIEDIKDECRALDIEFDETFEDLLKVESWEGDHEDVAEDVADAAGIKKNSEIDEFVDLFLKAKGETALARALQVLNKW